MDYDRFGALLSLLIASVVDWLSLKDALLHFLFKKTQGDAWFKPEEDITSGVAVRVNDTPEFRVFPYENIALEPFEVEYLIIVVWKSWWPFILQIAVTQLNPVVAVKTRNAAVHAALGEMYADSLLSFLRYMANCKWMHYAFLCQSFIPSSFTSDYVLIIVFLP